MSYELLGLRLRLSLRLGLIAGIEAITAQPNNRITARPYKRITVVHTPAKLLLYHRIYVQNQRNRPVKNAQ